MLAGPSGSGKSRLAARLHAAHGWPIFRLDDFYRDEDDPAMPRSEGLGIVDWDHPDSWDGDRAVAVAVRARRHRPHRHPRLRHLDAAGPSATAR